LSYQNGLCTRPPSRVAELGPGDSIGIGLAALLSGANHYYGLDALPLANLNRNAGVFEELIDLFRARAAIPGDDEFPGVKPKLRSYDFPARCYRSRTNGASSESGDRLKTLSSGFHDPVCRSWWNPEVIERGVVDMIFSQAVLEHVDGSRIGICRHAGVAGLGKDHVDDAALDDLRIPPGSDIPDQESGLKGSSIDRLIRSMLRSFGNDSIARENHKIAIWASHLETRRPGYCGARARNRSISSFEYARIAVEIREGSASSP